MINKDRKKFIVITGGTGFLGSNLVHSLLLADYNVIVIVRKKTNFDRISDLRQDARLTFVDNNRADIEQLFKEFNVDAVIHAATNYGIGSDSAEVIEANLHLPLLLSEMATVSGTRLFINIDSFFNKINRHYSALPQYSLSKQQLLDWLRLQSGSIRIVNAYLEHVYGPFDSATKFVEHVVQSLVVNKSDAIDLTYGDQKRDFVYVTDVVNALIAVLQHELKFQEGFAEYEIGTGESVSVRNFVKVIASQSCSPTTLNFGAIDYRHDEIMYSAADIAALSKIGWEPEYDICKGVAKLIQAYH